MTCDIIDTTTYIGCFDFRDIGNDWKWRELTTGIDMCTTWGKRTKDTMRMLIDLKPVLSATTSIQITVDCICVGRVCSRIGYNARYIR